MVPLTVFGSFKVTAVGVLGVIGHSVRSHVAGAFRAEGDTVTVRPLKEKEIIVRGLDLSSKPVTPPTAQVVLCVLSPCVF